MSREKITYQFRYQEPYHLRRHTPFLDRKWEITKRHEYGKSLFMVQVLGVVNLDEKEKLEQKLGRFPKRIRGEDINSSFFDLLIARTLVCIRQ